MSELEAKHEYTEEEKETISELVKHYKETVNECKSDEERECANELLEYYTALQSEYEGIGGIE